MRPQETLRRPLVLRCLTKPSIQGNGAGSIAGMGKEQEAEILCRTVKISG